MAAASGGHLRMLRWLRAVDAPWSAQVWYWAARAGRLRELRWMEAQRPRLPGGEIARSGAAHGGHPRVLRWLDAQGPPLGGRA